METELPITSVAGGHRVIHPRIGDLPQGTLGCREDPIEAHDQDFGGQPILDLGLDADKCGHIDEGQAKDMALADRHHGNRAQTQCTERLASPSQGDID